MSERIFIISDIIYISFDFLKVLFEIEHCPRSIFQVFIYFGFSIGFVISLMTVSKLFDISYNDIY